jgi:hypothetical protein
MRWPGSSVVTIEELQAEGQTVDERKETLPRADALFATRLQGATAD